MNCERCGQRPAAIRYSEHVDGEVKRQEVCAECAAALGFGKPRAPAPPLPPGKLLGVMDVTVELSAAALPPAADEAFCPACGLTAAEFRETALFGCPECWESFDEELDPVLKRLHGATQHRGRLPEGRAGQGDPGSRGAGR